MIRKTPNRRTIVSSLSESGVYRPPGHINTGAPGRFSRLRHGILPLLSVAMGRLGLFLAAARN